MQVIFQSIGIYVVLTIFFTYFCNEAQPGPNGRMVTPATFTEGEFILSLLISLGYLAFFLFLTLHESQKSRQDSYNKTQRAKEWRTRFDNSKDCQFFLSLIKHTKPSYIYLTHTQPAKEKAPMLPNRLYPQANPAVKPFTPCIELKDAKNTVIFSSAWPWDSDVRESMDYFYDWLGYHLPADLSYNRYHNTNSPISVSSKPSMYTMQETVDGRHIIYDNDLDKTYSSDSPVTHYGYVLYKKKTQ